MINCHTEKQAKMKLCCGPEGCGDEVRPKGEPKVRVCIASSCMAWRFQSAIWDLARNQWLQPGDTPEKFEVRITTEGYCGLAGGAS